MNTTRGKVLLLAIFLILSGMLIIRADASMLDNIDAKLIKDVSDYKILGIPLDKIKYKPLYTPQVLSTGHLPMILTSTNIKGLTINPRAFFTHRCVSLKRDMHFDYYVLKNFTTTRQIPIYDTLKDENGTEYRGVTGYKSVSDYYWDWVNVKDLKSFKVEDFIIVDIVGRTKATLKHWSVDVIPKIKYGTYEKEFKKYAWWDNNWNSYIPIKIDSSQVDRNLYNFPIMVNITDSYVLSHSQPDGDDIRFVSSDNTTEYYYEMEYWSPSRYAIFWVNVTKVSAITDTQINIYFNNSLATNGENRYKTWHSRYRAVYHMNDNSAPVVDSTQNHYNSTSTNNNPVYYQEGVMWKSIEYDDTSDGHIIPQIMTNTEVETHGYTHMCWFKANSLSTEQVTIGLYNDLKSQVYIKNPGTGYKYSIYIETDTGSNKWAYSSRIISTDQWYYGVAVYDKPSTTTKVYLDGKLEGTNEDVPSIKSASYTNTLGNTRTFGWGLLGSIDETRIYLGVLNDTYINVSYRSMIDSLLTWGSVHNRVPPTPPPPPPAPPVITDMYPANGSTDLCPCCINHCFTVSHPNGTAMNVTVYATDENDDYYIVTSFFNITNGTYCFTADGFTTDVHAIGHTNADIRPTAINTWYNITFKEFHSYHISGTGKEVIIPIDGHYTLFYWVSCEDDDASPAGDNIAFRMVRNGKEINGSYRELNFQKQDNLRSIISFAHVKLKKGDVINFQYIVNDLDIHINEDNTWTKNDTSAYATIKLEEPLRHPIKYNTTYKWYIYAETYGYSSSNTTSPVYTFTTVSSPDDCNITAVGGGGGGEDVGIVGVIGILGILGYIAYLRRYRRR